MSNYEDKSVSKVPQQDNTTLVQSDKGLKARRTQMCITTNEATQYITSLTEGKLQRLDKTIKVKEIGEKGNYLLYLEDGRLVTKYGAVVDFNCITNKFGVATYSDGKKGILNYYNLWGDTKLKFDYVEHLNGYYFKVGIIGESGSLKYGLFKGFDGLLIYPNFDALDVFKSKNGLYPNSYSGDIKAILNGEDYKVLKTDNYSLIKFKNNENLYVSVNEGIVKIKGKEPVLKGINHTYTRITLSVLLQSLVPHSKLSKYRIVYTGEDYLVLNTDLEVIRHIKDKDILNLKNLIEDNNGKIEGELVIKYFDELLTAEMKYEKSIDNNYVNLDNGKTNLFS